MSHLKPNFTQMPNVFVDWWMRDLEAGEIKVLLYIMRWTYGFQRDLHALPYNQIASGYVQTAPGQPAKRLDNGTGLSRGAVIKILNYLEASGAVIAERQGVDAKRGNLPTRWGLNLEWDGSLLDRTAWKESLKKGQDSGPGDDEEGGSVPQETRGASIPTGDSPSVPQDTRASIPQETPPSVPGKTPYIERNSSFEKKTLDIKGETRGSLAAPTLLDVDPVYQIPPADRWREEPSSEHRPAHLLWRIQILLNAPFPSQAFRANLAHAAQMLNAGYTEDQIIACWTRQRSRKPDYKIRFLVEDIAGMVTDCEPSGINATASSIADRFSPDLKAIFAGQKKSGQGTHPC